MLELILLRVKYMKYRSFIMLILVSFFGCTSICAEIAEQFASGLPISFNKEKLTSTSNMGSVNYYLQSMYDGVKNSSAYETKFFDKSANTIRLEGASRQTFLNGFISDSMDRTLNKYEVQINNGIKEGEVTSVTLDRDLRLVSQTKCHDSKDTQKKSENTGIFGNLLGKSKKNMICSVATKTSCDTLMYNYRPREFITNDDLLKKVAEEKETLLQCRKQEVKCQSIYNKYKNVLKKYEEQFNGNSGVQNSRAELLSASKKNIEILLDQSKFNYAKDTTVTQLSSKLLESDANNNIDALYATNSWIYMCLSNKGGFTANSSAIERDPDLRAPKYKAQ